MQLNVAMPAEVKSFSRVFRGRTLRKRISISDAICFERDVSRELDALIGDMESLTTAKAISLWKQWRYWEPHVHEFSEQERTAGGAKRMKLHVLGGNSDVDRTASLLQQGFSGQRHRSS